MADRTIPRRRKAQPAVPVPPGASHPGAAVTPLAPRLELVRPQSNAEVVELLRNLLRQAEAGEISGLIAVPLLARSGSPRKYGISLGGVARDNPQLAVGAMDVCQMLLREIALKDAGIG